MAFVITSDLSVKMKRALVKTARTLDSCLINLPSEIQRPYGSMYFVAGVELLGFLAALGIDLT